MIHIVGLYKCGTSWLLQILAAHPQVIAWREFDALRAVYAPDRRLQTLPLAVLDHLRPRPSSPAWLARQEAARARSRPEIFREMFLGRGWIPLMGADRQARAAALPLEDMEAVLDGLQALGDFRLRPDDAPALDPRSADKTLGFRSFRSADMRALMEAVRDTPSAESIPGIFFDSLAAQAMAGTELVCKAADQVMHHAALQAASPGSRILAVVRDGRDAAISARHFEALMRRREAPWRTREASSLRRLLGWSLRAAKLAEHARRGEVTILRYEDLNADFLGTCAALLEHLGLDSSPEILSNLRAATDFKTVTEGRDRGEAAEHIVRKGITGEWRETLSPMQAATAWRVAGPSLEAFGYGREGELRPSPLVLGRRSGA